MPELVNIIFTLTRASCHLVACGALACCCISDRTSERPPAQCLLHQKIRSEKLHCGPVGTQMLPHVMPYVETLKWIQCYFSSQTATVTWRWHSQRHRVQPVVSFFENISSRLDALNDHDAYPHISRQRIWSVLAAGGYLMGGLLLSLFSWAS